MSPAELESRVRALTLLLYDTRVSRPTLREKVEPYLAPDVAFVDPWLRAHGAGKFKIGLHGFHCVIHFDFDIAQMCAVISADGKRGRVLVEGTMNLRQLRFYTYPLRTILVYEVDLTSGERGLQVTKLEEMWSFGDMIANAPVLGSFYDGVFRPAAGYFFTAAFWLSCALYGKKAERAPT